MGSLSDEMFGLDGRRALVTGAGRGLGRAMSVGLAEAGADVALVARNAKELKETARKVELTRSKAAIFPYDLRDIDGLPELVSNVEASFEPIDILVNNAGMTRRGNAEEYQVSDWQDVMQVNLTAAFVLCRECGRRMVAAGKGKIINVGSLASEIGIPFAASYVASKSGLLGLTRALAVEWAGKGVNVNAIGPGYFETELTRPLINDAVRGPKIDSKIPMGRWGKPDELKGAVVFLASRASDYITGQILYVDGGWMAE